MSKLDEIPIVGAIDTLPSLIEMLKMYAHYLSEEAYYCFRVGGNEEGRLAEEVALDINKFVKKLEKKLKERGGGNERRV